MNGVGVGLVGAGLAAGLVAVLWLGEDDAAPTRLPVTIAMAACERAEVAAAQEREPVVARVATPEGTPVIEATANAARLQQLLRQIDNGDAAPELVRTLRDVLIAAPALVATVPDLLATGCLHERAETRLLQALELGASASCQQALAAIAADPRGNAARQLHCLHALGNVAEPTPATMQLLWSTFANGDADASRATLLAAGRATAALRGSDAVGYEHARQELLRALQLAAAPDAVANALQAMAQTGDAALAQTIAARLGDAAPAVRTAAACALVTVAAPDAATVLIAAFATENDVAVRRSLARLLGMSGVDACGAATLLPLLQRERDERVRECLATCLARG